MYAIKVTPDYYGNTCNAPQEALITYGDLSDNLQSTDYNIAEYETEEDAQQIIDTQLETDGIYYLSHGEAGRPSYEIIDPYNNLYPDCQNAHGEEFCEFEEIDAADLPSGIQSKLDDQNVEYRSSGNDYDVYVADVDHNNKIYRIAFCPTTVALQLNADDLSCIDWDRQAYFVKEGII